MKAEGFLILIFRVLLSIPLAAAVGIYLLLRQQLTPWAFVRLPDTLRIAGIAVTAGAVILLYFTHRAVGIYFHPSIHLLKEHKLITTGPYRFIQHPIYTCYAALFVGTFLFTRNWVIGACGLGIILLLMTVRLRKEEKALRERFGLVYEEYQRKTGRFFIKFRGPGSAGAEGPAPALLRPSKKHNSR